MTPKQQKRFWSKVDTSGECWVWRAFKNRDGYGLVWFHGSHHRAHRVAWVLTYGPIEPGLNICHTCDNPPCVNPAHLFQGTHADNVADRDAKGRSRGSPKGALNGRPGAKLAEQEVLAIRRAYQEGGVTQHALAHRFGVNQRSVSHIVTGKTWAWL